MRDAFMFDNRNGVKAYIKKLKGILMWNFLDVRACGDYFLKWIFRFFNGIIGRPSPT